MDRFTEFYSLKAIHIFQPVYPHCYQHMRLVIQRVKKAKVTVNNIVTAEIDGGLLVLAGIHHTDTKEIIEWGCNKISKLRIFEDEEGKMNRSVLDTGGSLLIVSQFTLYGDAKKGTRPSFIEAARPDVAEPLYRHMIHYLKETTPLRVEEGVFGAMMDIELINSGPVTLIIEKE